MDELDSITRLWSRIERVAGRMAMVQREASDASLRKDWSTKEKRIAEFNLLRSKLKNLLSEERELPDEISDVPESK